MRRWSGSAPLLNMRWRVVSTDDPQAEKSLEQWQKVYAEFGSPTIPAFHPLAVGDVLLMRTMQNLLAVDLATGQASVGSAGGRSDGAGAGRAAASEIRSRQAMISSGVGQRIWNDMTYGTLSSDGRYVFSVEDMGSEIGRGRFERQRRACAERRRRTSSSVGQRRRDRSECRGRINGINATASRRRCATNWRRTRFAPAS